MHDVGDRVAATQELLRGVGFAVQATPPASAGVAEAPGGDGGGERSDGGGADAPHAVMVFAARPDEGAPW